LFTAFKRFGNFYLRLSHEGSVNNQKKRVNKMKKIETKKETTISKIQLIWVKEIERHLNRKQDDEGWVNKITFHGSKGTDMQINKVELIYTVAHTVQYKMIGSTDYFYEITPNEEYVSMSTEKNTYTLIDKTIEIYEDDIKKLNEQLNKTK